MLPSACQRYSSIFGNNIYALLVFFHMSDTKYAHLIWRYRDVKQSGNTDRLMALFSRMCFFMNISYLVTQTKSFVDPYNLQTYSSKISDILPVSCWSLPSSLYTFINFSLFFMTNQQGFFLSRKNAGTFPVWKPLSAFLSASFRFMFLSQIPFLLLPLPSFTTLLP